MTNDNLVFTYRQIMELVLRYAGLKRFILSLPYFVGMIQGFFLEKLPENLFTVTRDQASPSLSLCHSTKSLSLHLLQDWIEWWTKKRLD